MKTNNTISLDGHSLSINDVISVSRNNTKVELSNKAKSAIKKSRAWVEKSVGEGKVMYGINTGFGAFKNIAINESQTADNWGQDNWGQPLFMI